MKEYKTAVIGLGNIGLMYDFEPQRPHPSTHVFAYEGSPAFRMVCAVDKNEFQKAYLKQVSSEARFFSDLNTAYEKDGFKDVDVVSICTPPSSHFEVIKFFIDRNIGEILFCEKPLVKDLKEADELRKLVSGNMNIKLIPNISRRWNRGLQKVSKAILEKAYGELQKINIRYTRGIYNTGTHLFDLLKMWTGNRIQYVYTLAMTETSAEPEKSFSFFFEQENGVTGYAEAVDDTNYYLFDIDLYFTKGKIEMRNSGDDILYYQTFEHHLFQGFMELVLKEHEGALLSDACLKNAVDNIARYLEWGEPPCCNIEDAIYPLYVAEALKKSYMTKQKEEVFYE